ncbi:unnamed protein product [Pleuronectes platessa]|uniref:Uncharacterized protein n=1 Tax=Pleuronectes platessa TaxID=8262 RepID=A0A9N7VEU1_PLEPL|nr:unnamed protein product [Pleuronectes platessa]
MPHLLTWRTNGLCRSQPASRGRWEQTSNALASPAGSRLVVHLFIQCVISSMSRLLTQRRQEVFDLYSRQPPGVVLSSTSGLVQCSIPALEDFIVFEDTVPLISGGLVSSSSTTPPFPESRLTPQRLPVCRARAPTRSTRLSLSRQQDAPLLLLLFFLLLLFLLLSGAVRRPELTLPGTERDEAPAGSPGTARRYMDVMLVETSLLVLQGPDGS